MNIVFFGPQGSGKGTQARLLCDRFKLSHFEAGAFLRDISKTNNSVKNLQENGDLVPDEEMCSYVAAYLDSKGLYEDIIFDGFPRTMVQYEAFKKWMEDKSVKIDLVFVINVSEEESIKRLSARRQDPKTGKVYNLVTDKPPVEVDLSSLTQRNDDKPEAIKKRLEIYKTQTTDLVNKIKTEIKVLEINGERSVDEIHKDLVKIIEETLK